MAKVDNSQLFADVEGLTLYKNDQPQWLIASSQGNNTYAVFDLNHDHQYQGSFAIVRDDKRGADGTSDTDGIEAYAGYINEDYPEGIFIAQDWYNIKSSFTPDNQNFKFVSWQEIQKSLN